MKSKGSTQSLQQLDLLQCPNHADQQLTHYSVEMREFLCVQCIDENPSTPFLKAKPIPSAISFLKGHVNRQSVEDGLLMLEQWCRYLEKEKDLRKKMKDVVIQAIDSKIVKLQ